MEIPEDFSALERPDVPVAVGGRDCSGWLGPAAPGREGWGNRWQAESLSPGLSMPAGRTLGRGRVQKSQNGMKGEAA